MRNSSRIHLLIFPFSILYKDVGLFEVAENLFLNYWRRTLKGKSIVFDILEICIVSCMIRCGILGRFRARDTIGCGCELLPAKAEILVSGRHLIGVLVFVLIRVGVLVRRHHGRRQFRRRHRLRLVFAIVVHRVLVAMQSFLVGVTEVVAFLALAGVLAMKEVVQTLAMNHRGNDADDDAQKN